MSRDKRIRTGPFLAARGLQLVYPAMSHVLSASGAHEFATNVLPAPTEISIPTRFGSIEGLLFSPTPQVLQDARDRDVRPPLHVHLHGGAFILQYTKTRADGNLARYLASELGIYVLMPKYRAAPEVLHPVAEQESFDAYRWAIDGARDHLWDTQRVTIGGQSTGGHFTLAAALYAITENIAPPLALTVEFAPVDLGLTRSERPYLKRRPQITDRLVQLIKNTYFLGADPQSPVASPIRHPRLAELPPTLLVIPEHDTLRTEMERFAVVLKDRGVDVDAKVYRGVDHGFTAFGSVERAREAVLDIGAHLAAAYAKSPR